MKASFFSMKLQFLFWSFTLINIAVYAQVKTVTFDELPGLQQKESRPVMVYIHTDWCKYCQAMKKHMLGNNDIATLLNRKYYAVFLNAETKEDINFNGKTFKYKPSGVATGRQPLAEELGSINNENPFPALCFLNERNEIIYQYGGFLSAEAFLKLLTIISKPYN